MSFPRSAGKSGFKRFSLAESPREFSSESSDQVMTGTPPIGPSWPLPCSCVWPPMPPASCFLWGPWVGWPFTRHPLRAQLLPRGCQWPH